MATRDAIRLLWLRLFKRKPLIETDETPSFGHISSTNNTTIDADIAGDTFNVTGVGINVTLNNETKDVKFTAGLRSFGLTIDGAGSTITTGIKGFIRIPVNGQIVKVTILSTDPSITSGSIVIDIWKDLYANYNPTSADTITSLTPPTITSDIKSEDAQLVGWNKTIEAGDVFGFSVVTVSSFKRITLIIDYQPT